MRRQILITAASLAAVCGAMLAQRGTPNEGQVQAGPRLRIDRDIEFARADGKPLRLDLYSQTPAAKPSPVVVWIHGDAALPGRSPTPAAALVTPGFAVASIDYRTGPGSTLTTQVADAKAAIRWLRANAAAYDLDPENIATMGFGTGGEVAAVLGTAGDVKALEGDEGNLSEPSRVQAVVDLAGPVDPGTVNPVAYVTKDDPPVLILHGTADEKVSTRDSQRFISALKVAGVNSTLELQVGVAHDVGQLLTPAVMDTVTGFLNQHLRGMRTRSALSSYLATPSTEYVDPVALNLGGTLYKTYPTPVRGPNTYGSYRLYLPPDYATNTTRRYPVIYFLHGANVDSKRPITSGYIARVDAAIRSNAMPPVIVIVVQGLNQGRWVDSRDGSAPMESVLIKNLVPHVDGTYRTLATREGRAIEGHSMGGYGALHNGFNNPDLFIAVTGNSPCCLTLDSGEGTSSANALNVVYGGERDYYTAMAPQTLAQKNAARLRQQQIRIICGTEDALFSGAKSLHEALVKINIPHEFAPVPGSPHNHDQLLQYEAFDTMAFYSKVFGKVTGGAASKKP